MKKYINNTEEVWIFKKSSILRQDENKILHSLIYQEIQVSTKKGYVVKRTMKVQIVFKINITLWSLHWENVIMIHVKCKIHVL